MSDRRELDPFNNLAALRQPSDLLTEVFPPDAGESPALEELLAQLTERRNALNASFQKLRRQTACLSAEQKKDEVVQSEHLTHVLFQAMAVSSGNSDDVGAITDSMMELRFSANQVEQARGGLTRAINIYQSTLEALHETEHAVDSAVRAALTHSGLFTADAVKSAAVLLEETAFKTIAVMLLDESHAVTGHALVYYDGSVEVLSGSAPSA